MRLPRAARAPGGRAGFSLAELMGVIVILGMLAMLTTITVRSVLPGSELNSSVRALAATLHEARSDAIARNAAFTIEYHFEAGERNPRGYRVITPFRSDGGGLAAADDERFTRAWVELPDSVSFKRIVVNGVEHREGSVQVWFDPLGGACDHTIVLEQAPWSNLYTIEVLALSGLIQFHEGEFVRVPPQDSDFR